MTLKFIDLYNDITGQAWSMFDSETESKEEFEASVTTSIQKALADLWFEYDYSFRIMTQKIKLKPSKIDYSLPNGEIRLVGSKYAVIYNKNYLDFVENIDDKEENITGEPELFYIENNKLCFYPVPDNNYIVSVDYLNMMPACNNEDIEQANLKEDTDYVNIDEKYEDLFKNALLPLAMVYLIASESDENYSAYMWQYQKALKKLKKRTSYIKKERVVGW